MDGLKQTFRLDRLLSFSTHHYPDLFDKMKLNRECAKHLKRRSISMREWIGTCKDCGENIYCENGFFNGVVLTNHAYLCFDCEEMECRKEDGDSK